MQVNIQVKDDFEFINLITNIHSRSETPIHSQQCKYDFISLKKGGETI